MDYQHDDNYNMNILALDTVANSCSVAIFSEGRTVSSHRQQIVSGHAEILVPMINDVISLTSFGFEDLNLIATTVGPGSFTGLRIGLATARSLSVAANIPATGVTSFEAVAAGLPKEEWSGHPVLIALETKRDDFYIQIFEDAGTLLGEPSAVPSANISTYINSLIGFPTEVLFAGDGAERAVKAVGDSSSLSQIRLASSLVGPDAIQVAEIAYQNHLSGSFPFPAEPLYLRPPHVHPPIEKG